MLLIGQYDSPFVRRVGIALVLYGFPFEQRPWSVFADADRIAHYNPLTRVPTLVLDDGEALIESAAILDHLDERAGRENALMPASGPDRRRALRVCALAMGLADKAVSLFYETALHPETSAVWVERCRRQIAAALDGLEGEGAVLVETPEERIGHAAVATAVAIRFLRDAHPALFDPTVHTRLARHAAACEARPAFRDIQQPFIPPA